MKEFKLKPRALHCFGEAKRVNDFEEACKREDLIAMGQLMNQSHERFVSFYLQDCVCELLFESLCLQALVCKLLFASRNVVLLIFD